MECYGEDMWITYSMLVRMRRNVPLMECSDEFTTLPDISTSEVDTSSVPTPHSQSASSDNNTRRYPKWVRCPPKRYQ